jgi:HK97 family phage portal protein
MLLEGGMDVKQLTIPPEQAQFLQTRKFQINEIARWFNIPPHMIGDLERSTNNNIEQQSIEFVQHSVMPWLNRIEQEFTRKLFYEDEKPDYYVEFNVEGLLRGDVKARAEYYRILWNIGAINANEIRSKENFNPYELGEKYYRPVNMEAVDGTSKNTDVNGAGETDEG